MSSDRIRIVGPDEGVAEDGLGRLDGVQVLADRITSQLSAAANAAERDREQSRREADRAIAELDVLRADNDRLEDELTERTADLDVARDELRVAQSGLADERARANGLSADLEDARRRAASLQERLDGSEQSGSATFRKVRELTELRDTMLEELERARAELGLRASRVASAQADADAARARAADMEQDNQRLQKELGQLIDRVFELEDLLVDTDSGEVLREVQRLRADNARLQNAYVQSRTGAEANVAPVPAPPLPVEDPVGFSSDDRARLEAERDAAREEVEATEHQLREVWAKLEDTARALDQSREESLELETLRAELGQLQRQRDELSHQVEQQRDKIRQLATMASSETYEREMAVARELLDGLERQCERAESRAAGYKTELVELRAINADLRKRLSAFGRRVASTRPPGRVRDLSDR